MRRRFECCFKRHLYLKGNSKLIFGKGVPQFIIVFSQTIQYRIWPQRPSLEDLLNYKTFSGFPPLDCDELGTALTFYNLALFSIYGNDGTTISTGGVIINKIISQGKGSRIKPVVVHKKFKIMILFISNS